MKQIVPWTAALMIALAGCSSPRETTGPAPAVPPPAAAPRPGAPDIILTVASLDLGRHGKRIESEDLERFAAILRRDTVDILLVEGVIRYPGVSTRVDIPDQLSYLTGMRNVFGETVSISGRQAGNAVFSMYPVTSSENTHFAGGGDEAALQAVIDCGVGPVVLVSTRLPDRATAADQTAAANTLNSFHAYYAGHPVIVSGNLPRDPSMRGVAAYEETRPPRGGDAPRVWYATGGTAPVAALGARAEETNLGPLTIARFGFFHSR